MSGAIPFERRAQVLSDLQTHGRCLALELRMLRIARDTLVNTGEESVMVEGWEVPAESIPEDRPLMIGTEGIYVSEGPRMIGRHARLIAENDVAMHGAAQVIRKQLHVLESKHAVFEKMRNGPKE